MRNTPFSWKVRENERQVFMKKEVSIGKLRLWNLVVVKVSLDIL